MRNHLLRQDVLLIAIISLLAWACADNAGYAEVDETMAAKVAQVPTTVENHPVSVEDITGPAFDNTYEMLLENRPQLHRVNTPGVRTALEVRKAETKMRAGVPICVEGASGEGLYPYEGYGIERGTGKFMRFHGYRNQEQEQIQVMGVVQAGTAIGGALKGLTEVNGVFYGINNQDDYTNSNRLYRFSSADAVDNGGEYQQIQAREMGQVRNRYGQRVPDVDCLTTQYATQMATAVKVEWESVGGESGDWFEVLRSDNPIDNFSVVSIEPIEWNELGSYCYVDVSAACGTNVYYRIRAHWGDGCYEDSLPFFVTTEC